jgi:hypothetical protein
MLYSFANKDFKHHVHPSLKRRIKIFMLIGAIMIAIMMWDIFNLTLPLTLAVISIAIGAVVGFMTSRIFHLSWSHDGQQVVGRIDAIGWIMLALYIGFEIARSVFFQDWVPHSATAVTFAFVASALIARVLGLRGRIIDILKKEKVFG